MRFTPLHLAQALARRTGFGFFIFILFLSWFCVPKLHAHNVDQRVNWMALDDVTRAMIKARAAASDFPLLRANDELGIVIKASPVPSGATTGVGGYLTFYPPEGVQITGASYVLRDGLGGFLDIPLKGQAIIAIGDGSVGGKDTPDLIGLTLGPNAVGQTEDAVDEDGLQRGTLAGLYGDTGIFYAVDPDTAWQSWSGGTMQNNRGETITPTNTWDADQLRAYGWKNASPIIDPDGRGSTPWGLGSPVAGPQSGYAWQFDGAIWDASAKTAADLRASITLGPWIRMQYPGSQVGFDQPGLASTDLGYAGVVTALGTLVDAANPLPATTDLTDATSPKAVRWSVGMLQTGNFEYVRVWVKILADAGEPDSPFDAKGCFEAFADVGGGDAGGEQGGKDHPWRYYDPSYATINPASVLTVQGSKDVVQNGKLFKYDIEYVNASTVTMTNVVIMQTLPGKVRLISSTPAQESGPNPMRWTVASLAPGEKFTATVNVRAESSGELVISRVEATNAQGCPALAEEGTWLGENPVLVPSVSAMPSNAAPGDTIQYTIRVDNTGAGPSGNELIISDSLAEHFTFVRLDSVWINGGNTINQTTVDASDPRRPLFIVQRAIPQGTPLELTFTARVAANAPSGTYYNTFGISHRDPVLGKDVTIASGPQAPVVIGVAALGDTVFRDWNGNGVHDLEDEGIAGVTLQLDSGQMKTTDADGNYLFNNLPASTFEVDVTDTGGVLSGHTLTAGTDPSPVTLASGEERLDIDFGYLPGGSGSIEGLVFDDKGNDGQFNTGLGDVGITGITVRLYEDTNGDGIVDGSEDAVVATTASASGSYSFTGLALGISYVVDVDDADITTYFASSEWVNSTAEPQVISDLAGPLSDLDFGYYLVVPGSISGSVYRDTNQNGTQDGSELGIVATTLRLYQDSNGNASLDGGEPLLQTTQSSGDGTYAFLDLGAGDYVIDLDQSSGIPAGYLLNGSDPLARSLFNSENAIGIDFPFEREVAGSLAQTVNRLAADPGDTLTYAFEVEVDAGDVVGAVAVSSPVPPGTSYVPASANAGGSESGGTVAWNLGSNLPRTVGSDSNAGSTTVSRAISQSSDDVEEVGAGGTNLGGPGNISTTSADLELVQEDEAPSGGTQIIGLRFQNIPVPKGETIRNAYVRFRAVEPDAPHNNSDPANLTIQGQAADNPGTFTATNSAPSFEVSSRATTAASVNWSPGSWTTGTDYDTPDLSAIVQETVNRGGWSSGNSMVLIMTGTGSRSAEAFDDPANNEPELVIEYGGIDSVTNEISLGQPVLPSGREVSVTQVLTASSSVVGVTPSLSVSGTNGATASLISGPSPASATVGPAGASFLWVFEVTSAGDVGQLTFSGEATAGAVTWPTASSNSLIVAPPLSFQATINDPAGVVQIENTGAFEVEDGSGGPLIPPTNSNTVVTLLSGSVVGELVWVDLDADGVRDDNEAGLDGVEVCATNGTETVCATSDADGAYLITGISPGAWNVAVNLTTVPSGYLPTTSPSIDIVLADLETNTTARFGFGLPGDAAIIGGKSVWIDTDADGVRDSNELALGGVTINLHRDKNANGLVDSLDVLIATTTTAADGGYAFTGLPADNYLVSVDEDSGVSTGFGGNTMIGAAMNLVSGTNPHLVMLSSGATYTDAKFGYLWGGSIGDTVWYDLNGNAIQEASPPDGGGVEEVALLLYYDTDGDGSKAATDPIVRFTLTNSAGNYLFNNLPPGTYVVDVDESTVPAPPSSANAGAYDLVVSTTGDERAVSLLPMENYSNADFGWIEAGTVGDVVFRDTNSNGVRDSGESGLPDIRVNLSGTDLAGRSVTRVAVTDMNGRYSFLIPPGSYVASYDTNDSDIPASLTVPTTAASISAQISPGSAFTDADFGRGEGGTIKGTVFSDVDGDGSQSFGEPGLSGITTYLHGAGGGSALAVNVTDAQGFYQFNGAEDDSYIVEVDLSTIPSAYSATADPDESGVCTLCDGEGTALIAGGNTVSGINFGFQRSGTLFGISGVVYDDVDGNGVRDSVLVEKGLESVAVIADCGGDGRFVSVTDAAGSWSVLDVPSGGSCDVSVDESTLPNIGYEVTTAPVISLSNITSDVVDQDFGYQLVAGAVEGRVVEGNGNGIADAGESGLAGVTVTVKHPGSDGILGSGDDVIQSMVTDGDGQYSFIGIPEGSIQIVETDLQDYVSLADADGGNPNVISLQLSAGDVKQNQDFEDEYQPPADISGIVFSDLSGNGIQDGGEAGLTGVTVDLYLDVNNNDAVESGDTLLGNETTGVSGDYIFFNKPAGNYLVKVSDTDAVLTNYVGTTPDPHDVTLAGSDYSQAHFGFQPPTASIGDLVWLDGNGNGVFDSGTESGIAGVTVDLYRDGNKNGALDGWDTLVNATVTSAGGGYDFIELPAGNYLVKVTDLSGNLTGLARSGGTDPHVHILVHNEDYNGADFGFVASPLAKRVDKAGGTPGDILTYTLTPSYSGNAPLTDLTITDNVPDGTVYVTGSASPVLASGPDPLTWNLGSHTAADQGRREASGLGTGAELSVFALRGDDKMDFWKYSPEDNLWSVLASTPGTVKEGGALVTDNDDRLWALRGDDAMDFWRYTVSTNTWTVLASTPQNVKHGGALAYNGTDIYALRGEGFADFWRYDIAADAWTILAPFPDGVKVGVKEGGSLTAFGSAIYGLRGDGTSEFYRYDPGTNTWTALAGIPLAVKKGGSLATDGEDIYALRGDGKKEFYRYDVGSNTWTALALTFENVNEGGALGYSGAGFFAFRGNAKEFWHYDIDTNAWEILAETTDNVKWGGALAVITSATTLIVDMAASPSVVTESGSVSVVLTATASEEVLGFAAPALSVLEVNGATAVLDSGPVPATADLAPDVPMDFTYTYTVSAGAGPGSVRFSTPDFTTGDKSWPDAASNSVLATPPLSFQVEIASATTLPLVTNVATIADITGALLSTESTPANTVLTKADIAGQIRFDLDGDADPADSDPGIFGATVELYTDLDGDQDATGETLIASVVTGSQGNYNFGDVPRGRYVIVAWDRPGTSSTYDTQGSLTDNQIALTAIVDSAGHDFLDANFSKPASWNAWKGEFNSVLGSQNQPDQNPDGDIYDNLLEYALCLHPGTGLPGPGGFQLEVSNDHVDAVFFRARGGLTDITYLFQGRSELPIEEIELWNNLVSISGTGAPPSGVTVTDLGNGIEEVRLTQVDLLEPLTGTNGFVRLEVVLDNGSATGSSYTQVFGWSEVTIEKSRFQTYSNPLLKHETLSGTIDSVWGTHTVLVTTSLGDADLSKVLNLGKDAFYIEIIEGDFTGHRFDISAAGIGSMGLAADGDPLAGPPFNTMHTAASIPSALAGDQFVLREHFTLDQYFPPQSPFTARQTSLDAENPPDRIFFFDGGWEVYWLFNNSNSGAPFWDLDGNASFIDAGKRVIPPQEGIFLHVGSQSISFLNIGIVRKNDFIVPLKQGYNLIAGGFPMDQAPAVRGMSPSIFEGNPDPALADSIFTWLGDTSEPEDEYQAYFLLENAGTTTPRWSYWEDPTLTPRDWDMTVFPRNRSSFIFRVHNPLDDYVMYLPWCVGLIGE